MIFFVKTPLGRTISLDISASTTIADIIKILADKEDEVNNIFLVASGKKLMDTDEIIVNEEDRTAYIYSAQSQAQLSLSDVTVHMVNSSYLDSYGSDTTFLDKTTNLWQQNKISLIVVIANTTIAIAILIATFYPSTGIPIGSALAINLLTIAGGLIVIAGILLLKICFNELNLSSTESTLPQGWESTGGICQRYIMLDHGGVLDGEIYHNDINQLDQNDLILNKVSHDLHMVLKNGVIILQQLSELATNHNFRIVFHSKNHKADQQRVWQQIKNAAILKNVQPPPLFAMVVYDANQYPDKPPKSPSITNDEGVMIIGYGVGEMEGKSCVRQALSSACNISIKDRKNCFVFDDGITVINMAHSERYKTYLIGNGSNSHTLTTAIEDLYKKILMLEKDKKNSKQQLGSFSIFTSSNPSTQSNQTNLPKNLTN